MFSNKCKNKLLFVVQHGEGSLAAIVRSLPSGIASYTPDPWGPLARPQGHVPYENNIAMTTNLD